MSNILTRFLSSYPRWYLAVLGVLFAAYLCGWGYMIHLAGVQETQHAAILLPVEAHDSSTYAALSESLRTKLAFTQPGEVHEYFITPGYPFFVAVIRSIVPSYFAVTFMQILMVFAVALMIVALGTRLRARTIGLFASILFLLNPIVPYICLFILTDTLFTFLFVLGFTVITFNLRSRPLFTIVVGGLFFAAAIYVRPVGFFSFPVLVSPILAATGITLRRKLLYVLALLVLVSALLTPWMIRNKIDSGVFGFSSLVPLNFTYYALPHFLSERTGASLASTTAQMEQGSGVPRGNDAYGYPQNWYNLHYSPQLSAYDRSIIFANPISYPIWHLYNSSGFFFNAIVQSDYSRHINIKQLLRSGQIGAFVHAVTTPWWQFAERVAIGLGFIAMLAGMVILWRNPLAWAFAFSIFYMGALGGPASQARYRLPLDPFITLFIATAILVLASRFARRPLLSLMSTEIPEIQSTPTFISWAANTPLLRGIRGNLGGRTVLRAIEAKNGQILYYNEPQRLNLFRHVHDVKQKTRTLLLDAEAMLLYETVEALAKVPGDIAEVGMYRGGSTRLIAEAAGDEKQIYAFDTFEGLPPLEDFDDKRFVEGAYAAPVDVVREYLSPYPNVHIYEGLFPDTAGPIKDKTFSFVHLDVDIYQSTLDGLKFFYPRLSKGGVLISHDYTNAEGVRRAFREFLADKPEAVFSMPGTQGMLVKI